MQARAVMRNALQPTANVSSSWPPQRPWTRIWKSVSRLTRKTRPKAWHTLEEPTDLSNALTPVLHHYDTVLLDCLTLWVSNLLLRSPDIQSARKEIPSEVEALLGVYRKGNASWIIVSNEVGLGVVPATELGRIYADELGRANQLIAAQADDVYFMAAGLPLTLKGPNHKGISPVRQAANTSDLQRP